MLNTVTTPRMAPFAEFIGATDPERFIVSFWIIYAAITLLSIIVFNLGFARKLPLLKNIIIYALLLFGNMFMTFLAFSLPIVESLFIAGLVLGMYKIQLRRHQKATKEESVEN